MGGASPAAVDNADQLLFVTVVPHCQLHLAQGPNRSLGGTVGRGRQQHLGTPSFIFTLLPAYHSLVARPLTCHHVLGDA